MRPHLPMKAAAVAMLFVAASLTPVVVQAQEQERDIRGQVSSAETGEPLGGAHISVLGTNIGVLSGENGNFSLSVSDRDVVLSVQLIGYITEEVRVPTGLSSVTIELQRDVLGIDEIVVTGRATGVRRRISPNAVSRVSAQELNEVPASSVEKSLQGKMAGVNIIHNSGAPGGGNSMEIRGVTTVIGDHTPLYVIDGVIASNVTIQPGVNSFMSALSSSMAGAQDNGVNRIADLNPEDVESIEVLKGPSAAAIYGSKAAGGVVIITTKRGQEGATRFSLGQKVGISQLSRKVGFRRFETEEEAVSAFGSQAANYWEEGRFFDHEQHLAGRKPISFETTGSARGASEGVSFYASGLVRREPGVIPTTYADKRSLRLNLEFNPSPDWQLGLRANVLRNENDRGLNQNSTAGTTLYGGLASTPSFFDLRPDENGVYPENPFSPSNSLQTRDLFQNKETTWRTILGASSRVELLSRRSHALSLDLRGGVDFFTQGNEVYSDPRLQWEPNDGLPGTAQITDADHLNSNVSANLIHVFTSEDGGLQATTSAGVQYETQDLNLVRNQSQNLIGGLPVLNAGTVLRGIERRERVEDYGVFVQEEVVLDDRLMLSAGVRADRSSTNADTDQFFIYPKASASYIVPLEAGPVDELKFRTAYGQTGNRPQFGQKFTELLPATIAGVQSVSIGSSTVAPDLHPERQEELEAGVDATLFDGDARLELTVAQNDISEVMLERTLPPASGYDVEIRNGGQLRVRSFEAGLDAQFSIAKLQVQPRLTFALDRCKVQELPVPTFRRGGFGLTIGGARQLEEGKSCTQIVGFDSTATTGEVVQVGNSNSDFAAGFSSTVTSSDWRFHFLWDWDQGPDLFNGSLFLLDAFANSPDYDELTAESDGLTGQERLVANGGHTRVYLQDASFVKLRELSLSYDLPESVLTKVWGSIRSARLTLRGRDLLTLTSYRDTDPEINQRPGPQASTVRNDIWGYPPSRSVWLSLDLSF